jgi:hypothetical protein
VCAACMAHTQWPLVEVQPPGRAGYHAWSVMDQHHRACSQHKAYAVGNLYECALACGAQQSRSQEQENSSAAHAGLRVDGDADQTIVRMAKKARTDCEVVFRVVAAIYRVCGGHWMTVIFRRTLPTTSRARKTACALSSRERRPVKHVVQIVRQGDQKPASNPPQRHPPVRRRCCRALLGLLASTYTTVRPLQPILLFGAGFGKAC